jgi:UV DNA damage repair endonuclease
MENAPFNKRRAHSAFIHNVPPLQLQAMQDDAIDVDIEAKMKNIALLRMRKEFNIKT